MKHSMAVAFLCATFMGSAIAQTSGVGTGTGTAAATGGALNFSPTYGDSINRYAASSAIAPQLVAGIDTCMGSSSLGGSATTFSFSVGTTWKDEDCRMLKNSRELYNMGQRVAGLARLCEDDDINYAIAVSGGIAVQRQDGAIVHIACPMSKAEWIAKGRPLLDPATGQPYTTAQLNPPSPSVMVGQAPSSSAVDAGAEYAKLSPEQKASILKEAKIEAIEAKAKELGDASKVDSVASK
jgi:hypothetical protein